MSTATFKDLVIQAKELGAEWISPFGYGEPLLDPDLENKIEFCAVHGLKTFITTNASVLTWRRGRQLLDAGLTKIRISAHGLGKNYERVHKGLSWPDVYANIVGFLLVNEELYESQCEVGIIVIPFNNDDVSEIKKFWARADNLEIWSPHNWTDGKSFRKVSRKKKTCGRPFTGPIQINADGTVIVCCFDYNGVMVVGDTSKNSLKEIINGPEYNYIRSKHTSGDLSGLLCENCDQLNIEEKSPLIYSSIDPICQVGKTSSTKFSLEEK